MGLVLRIPKATEVYVSLPDGREVVIGWLEYKNGFCSIHIEAPKDVFIGRRPRTTEANPPCPNSPTASANSKPSTAATGPTPRPGRPSRLCGGRPTSSN